jgi:hypothetical protein
MRDYPDLADEYKIEGIEDEIIRYLDSSKKVYIESGAANDRILSYSDPYGYGREIVFTTTGSIFPKQVCLFDYSYVDCEDFEGNLFVQVG